MRRMALSTATDQAAFYALPVNTVARHAARVGPKQPKEGIMNVLLLQLDGKIPNLALMRIARHHRDLGDHVWLRQAGNQAAIQPKLDEPTPGKVYASAIFTRSLHLVQLAEAQTTETRIMNVLLLQLDGKIQPRETVAEIWRGDPWPRHILLLDNDFFGNPAWEDRVKELTNGKFKVCINQGINAKMLNAETAAVLAGIDYRDDQFKMRRLYTALDNPKDRDRFLKGLLHLTDHGVRPHHIFVYMLIGYSKGETHNDRDQRRRAVREFGALLYPMPYERTPELIAFQRWVVGGYDRTIPWDEWRHARYQPTNLDRNRPDHAGLNCSA